MFGEAFAPSYNLAAILSLGVVSMTFYKIIGVLLLAEGRRIFYFTTLATAVASNVAINYITIPGYGATGAAVVSVITYSLTGAVFVVHFCRSNSIDLRDALAPRVADLKPVLNLVTRSGR